MENELSGPQMKILEEIKKKPCYIEEISKKTVISVNYISIQAKGLIKDNLVNEEKDKYDRRKKILSITPMGILILEKNKTKPSLVAQVDDFLDKNFKELGIDCKRLFG